MVKVLALFSRVPLFPGIIPNVEDFFGIFGLLLYSLLRVIYALNT